MSGEIISVGTERHFCRPPVVSKYGRYAALDPGSQWLCSCGVKWKVTYCAGDTKEWRPLKFTHRVRRFFREELTNKNWTGNG